MSASEWYVQSGTRAVRSMEDDRIICTCSTETEAFYIMHLNNEYVSRANQLTLIPAPSTTTSR